MVMRKYTEAEKTFLYEFVPGHSYKEIKEAFDERFPVPISTGQIKSFIGNNKLNTGRTGRFEKGHIPANKGKHNPTVGRMGETQFKKGNLPPNTKPIGYERITRDGYVEVKIKMRPSSPTCNDNFVLKQKLVWEQENGPIPAGYKIIFLDGDKTNCDIDNLRLVSNQELLEANRKRLLSIHPALNETGILIAKTNIAIRKAQKR